MCPHLYIRFSLVSWIFLLSKAPVLCHKFSAPKKEGGFQKLLLLQLAHKRQMEQQPQTFFMALCTFKFTKKVCVIITSMMLAKLSPTEGILHSLLPQAACPHQAVKDGVLRAQPHSLYSRNRFDNASLDTECKRQWPLANVASLFKSKKGDKFEVTLFPKKKNRRKIFFLLVFKDSV